MKNSQTRPIWYPSKAHMLRKLVSQVAGWIGCIVVFGGIGAMLAWRG